jgi:inhibitor of cysteine peptidase
VLRVKKRKIIMVAVVLAMVLFCPAALASGSGVDISLDGNHLGVQAQVDGYTVLLPVRAVCEALGYEVTWSEKDGSQAAVISKGGDSVTLNLTRQEINDNGHTYYAGVYSGEGIMILSGRMYLDSGLFSSIFPVRFSYAADTNRVTATKLCENSVTVTTEKTAFEKEHLRAELQFPQLSGLPDAEAQKSINAILEKSAQDALAEGEKNAADMAQAIRDGYTGAVGMCETYYNYMVQYNQNGLISIVLTNYQYAGGAHGSTVQSAYTFELSTGRALRLGNIMDGRTEYTGLMNDAIRREIDRRVAAGELYEFEFSKFKGLGENPEFYLSNDAVVLYFQEYAYFPYAAGIQEFRVRYADLESMIKDEYQSLYSIPVVLEPRTVNTLSVGAIGQVVLKGNPTTGYSWHFEVSGDGVLALVSECYSDSSQNVLVGGGGRYIWNFKALKAGEATVTFKYYRAWEGESSATAENTVIFRVLVQ